MMIESLDVNEKHEMIKVELTNEEDLSTQVLI